MKNNRRDFLKVTGLVTASMMAGCATKNDTANANDQNKNQAQDTKSTYKQQFNMSGYAAPALETVRIGFIGLGNRGPGAVERMSHIEGVDIKALCDLRPERVTNAQKILEKTAHKP